MELRKYRQHKDLTLRKAAAEIGCSISHLSRAERGRPVGEDVAFRIQAWTGGMVQAGDLCPTIKKIMERI